MNECMKAGGNESIKAGMSEGMSVKEGIKEQVHEREMNE